MKMVVRPVPGLTLVEFEETGEDVTMIAPVNFALFEEIVDFQDLEGQLGQAILSDLIRENDRVKGDRHDGWFQIGVGADQFVDAKPDLALSSLVGHGPEGHGLWTEVILIDGDLVGALTGKIGAQRCGADPFAVYSNGRSLWSRTDRDPLIRSMSDSGAAGSQQNRQNNEREEPGRFSHVKNHVLHA